MFKFFKNKDTVNNTKDNNNLLIKTAALFIHAAKIDENYTDREKDIIKKTLIKLGAKLTTINEIMFAAEKNEEESNQILDFTKDIKNTDNEFKIKIIEALWSIIYSNKEADMYEANLMRRLAGLLYLDNKIMGDIKEKVKKNFIK